MHVNQRRRLGVQHGAALSTDSRLKRTIRTTRAEGERPAIKIAHCQKSAIIIIFYPPDLSPGDQEKTVYFAPTRQRRRAALQLARIYCLCP